MLFIILCSYCFKITIQHVYFKVIYLTMWFGVEIQQNLME